MRPRLTLVLAAVAAAALLVGCGSPAASSQDGLSVVASIDVYGAVAAAVGGPDVRVTSIIDSPGADPHEYESTPRDALAVSKAKLMIYNGAGYDDFATKVLAASGATPATIDVVQLSGAAPAGGGEFNEHVWYSLATVRKLADAIAADLGAADATRAATFTANAQAFDAKIDTLAGKVAAIKARHAGQRVAITEPVPLHLIEAAGLVDATPPAFSTAVEQGSDPAAAVLQQTVALFSGPDRVRALVPNAQSESPTTKQVEQAAQAGGVPVVPVTETLPAGTTDYVTWMGAQIDALAAALDRA
jgi:zinc/manganese transport system substrate-binding protein